MKKMKARKIQRVGKARVGGGMGTGNAMPRPVRSVSSNRTGSSKFANTKRPTGARLR